MSKLDVAKETIGYLKLALVVMVATDIGLMSWLFTSSGSVPVWKALAAVIAVMMITGAVIGIHRQIMRRINDLEEL